MTNVSSVYGEVYLRTILEKVMVKLTLGQAMKIHRQSRGTGLFFLWPRHQIGVHNQRHAPAALPPRKRSGTQRRGKLTQSRF